MKDKKQIHSIRFSKTEWGFLGTVATITKKDVSKIIRTGALSLASNLVSVITKKDSENVNTNNTLGEGEA